MFILKSAIIEGLWGDSKPIYINFDKEFNFLIGKNGCGKTTVINLIAAVLVCDYERLDKIPFSRIVLNMQSSATRKVPSIDVIKTRKSGIPYFDIVYQIKDSQTAKPIRLAFDELNDQNLVRHISARGMRDRVFGNISNGARESVAKIVKVSWLSVHRKSDDDQIRDDRRNMPAVDQKLSTLANDLVRYFSAMSKKYEDQTKDFQKKSFLSLITYERENQVLDFAKKIDVDSEKKGLSAVFELLQLEPKEYASKVQQSYEKFSSARDLFIKNEPMLLNQFFAIFNVIKAHSLVQYYEDLQGKGSEIFFPREEFLSVLNVLFEGRKIVSISPRNELRVRTKFGNEIKLEELSSGEKQLIIILGEALLQEGEPVVYIADEPELSLHVSWQEQLTGALVRLNPKAQIVFATHSPDIVGVHQDKVLDMEKLVA
jgi:energy-coupling factor transporter ATP-binding protein EcfA2